MAPAGLDFVGLSDSERASLVDVTRRAKEHGRTVADTASKTNAPEYAAYREKWDAFQKNLDALNERADSTFSWVWASEIEGAAKDYDLLLSEWSMVPLRIGVAKQQDQIRVLEDLVEERTKGRGVVPNFPQSQAGPSDGGFLADARRATEEARAAAAAARGGSSMGLPSIPDVDLNSAIGAGIKLAKWGLVGVVLLKVYETAPGIISRIRKW